MKTCIALIATALTLAPAAAQPSGERPLAIGAADADLNWGPCPSIFPSDCRIAVLHGDPGKPGADLFLRVRGGTILPPHQHTSAERMILVGGTLRVDYKGAPPVTLQRGDYAYGPAGVPHSASCLGKRPCTLFIAFNGPVDALPHSGGVD